MADSHIHGIFTSLLSGKSGTVSQEVEGLALSKKDEVSIQEQEISMDVKSVPVRSSGKVGQIALDVYEEGEYVIIKAPIAGIKMSDLDIDIVGNAITIRGHRLQSDEIRDEQYYVQECYWGDFERSVTLPFSPNPSRVKATFNKDNILKIYVPKEGKVKIVKINEGG